MSPSKTGNTLFHQHPPHTISVITISTRRNEPTAIIATTTPKTTASHRPHLSMYWKPSDTVLGLRCSPILAIFNQAAPQHLYEIPSTTKNFLFRPFFHHQVTVYESNVRWVAILIIFGSNSNTCNTHHLSNNHVLRQKTDTRTQSGAGTLRSNLAKGCWDWSVDFGEAWVGYITMILLWVVSLVKIAICKINGNYMKVCINA